MKCGTKLLIQSSFAQASSNNFIEDLGGGVSLEMIALASGTFLMGSNYGDESEKPVHSVKVPAFSLGK